MRRSSKASTTRCILRRLVLAAAFLLLAAGPVAAQDPVSPRGLSPVNSANNGNAVDPLVLAPSLYVLAVGVSAYEHAELQLHYAAKDARDLAASFARQKGLLYREVSTRVLLDQDATKARVLDGLEWIQRQTTARDVAVVFLAGHGINDPGTGRYHFLPVDAELSAIKRTMLSQDELQGSLRSIAGKVLLFLDSCHSGNVLSDTMTRGTEYLSAELTRFITELAATDNGVVVFAASTGKQPSREAQKWGNGVFTRAVIEGLQGGAAFVKGRPITVNMLDLYISERVKELTGGVQTPATAKPSTLPDFPIAVALERGKDAALQASILEPAAPALRRQPAESAPVYKKWWLWAGLGVVVGAVAIGVGVGVSRAAAQRDLYADVPIIYDLKAR